MERFGKSVTYVQLQGSMIHRLENVITMSNSPHKLFDDLELWLEATVSYIYSYEADLQ